MLTLGSILKTTKMNSAYGLTGGHSLSNGFETAAQSGVRNIPDNEDNGHSSQEGEHKIYRRWNDETRTYDIVKGPK